MWKGVNGFFGDGDFGGRGGKWLAAWGLAGRLGGGGCWWGIDLGYVVTPYRAGGSLRMVCASCAVVGQFVWAAGCNATHLTGASSQMRFSQY